MGASQGSARARETGEVAEEDAEPFTPQTADCVFTAYFEGTANVVEKRTTQIGLFHSLDEGVDVYDPVSAYEAAVEAKRLNGGGGERTPKAPVRLKMGLNGCGAENGLAGVVFAYGMQSQCDAVAAAVKAVRCALGDEATLQLNVVGLSRGAVAALTVAAMMAHSPDLFAGGRMDDYDGKKQEGHERGWSTSIVDGWNAYSKPIVVEEPPEEEEEEEEEEPVRRLLITVPEGMQPGQTASFTVDGRSLRLVIPAGSKPGTKFQIALPDLPKKEGEKQEPPPIPEAAEVEKQEEERTTLTVVPVDQRTRLHLLLFDPVPGNQILTTSMLDPFSMTTGNLAMDVTKCLSLRRVLAIYPYEPLPAITFHAPLVPEYPPSAHVDEVATLGCHQGAMLCTPHRISCRLSYAMVRSFLTDECGITLRGCRPFDEMLQASSSTLRVLEMLRVAAIDDAKKHQAEENSRFVVRDAHAKWSGVAVVRHANGIYLNAFHHHLAATQQRTANDTVAARISDDRDKLGGAEPLYLLDVVRPSSSSSSSSSPPSKRR